MSSEPPPGDAPAVEPAADRELIVVARQEFEARFHAGPIPDPRTLRELAEIYPKAVKIIFDNFDAQSAHRRELERLRVETSAKLAARGQLIGGGLAAVGLVGSLVAVALGHGLAGFGIALTSLVSLVSVFVYGREQQRRERVEKSAVQEQIRQGAPVEQLEAAPQPSRGEVP